MDNQTFLDDLEKGKKAYHAGLSLPDEPPETGFVLGWIVEDWVRLRQENSDFISAIEKLKPYIYEKSMEGETSYELAVIALLKLIGAKFDRFHI